MSSGLNFRPIDLSMPDEECSICMQPLIEKLTAHGIHVFHIDCIAKWIRKNPNCPLCKAAVNADTVFEQQSFYTRTQQALQSIDCKETAFKFYDKAKPYIFTAIPYTLRYVLPFYLISNPLSAYETMCEAMGSGLICSSLPLIKTTLIASGVAAVIYDHWDGHLLGHHSRHAHGIPEIFG